MSIRSTLVEGFYEITLSGRPYKVKSLIDEGAQTQFERVLYQRYLSELIESKVAMSEPQYQFELSRLRANRRNGFYGLKTVAGLEFFSSSAGTAELLKILIPAYDGADIMDAILANMAEVTELLAVITNDSFPEAIKKKKEADEEEAKKKTL